MQIYEVKNDIAEILYAPDENNLFLSDFLFLEDSDSTIVSQVTDISTTERPDINIATVKFYLSVDKENRLTQYDGHTPSKNAEVGYLDTYEITGLFKPKTKGILWGSYIRNPELKISTDLKFLSSNCCAICDRAEQSTIFTKNLLRSLDKANVRSLLLDFEGKYKTVKSTQSVTFGEDYRIPLNSKALDYIFENDLNDCPIDAKVIIQNIILEIQKYTDSLPEGFLPFKHFLKIIMAECKSSNNAGLLIFCNKLLKYKQKKIFADKETQFKSVNNCQGSLKIDISGIDAKYHNLILNSIISTIEKKVYVISDVSEDNLNSETLKHIYDKQNVRLIPIVNYEDKYINKIKSYCRNMVLFAPTVRKNFDDTYNSFVNKLTPNEFIICGESTLYIPLIITLKTIVKDDGSTNEQPTRFDEISSDDLDDLDFINAHGDEITDENNEIVEPQDDVMTLTETEIEEDEEEIPVVVEEDVEEEIQKKTEEKVEEIQEEKPKTPFAEMPKAQPTERNPLRFDMEKLLGNSKPAPQTFQQPTQTVEKSAFQPVQPIQPTQTTQPVQPEPINIVEEPQPLPVMQEVKLEEAIIEEEPQIVDLPDEAEENEIVENLEEEQISEPISKIDETQDIEDTPIIEEIIQDEPEVPQIQEVQEVQKIQEDEEPEEDVQPTQAASATQPTPTPAKEEPQQVEPQQAVQQNQPAVRIQEQQPKKPVPNADELPIYEPKVPEKTVEVFEEGARVTHAKYGVGTVEKIIKYGKKNLCSIQFDAFGRRLLDPNITTLERI